MGEVKAIVDLFERVKSAADALVVEGSPEEERCLTLLKELGDFPVDYELLASCKLGKPLKDLLKKHSNTKIKALASEVLGHWEELLMKEFHKRRRGGAGEGSGVKEAGKVPFGKSTENPVDSEPNKRRKTEKGPVATDIERCNIPSRDRARELFAKALCKAYDEVYVNLEDAAMECNPYQVAVELEKAMFDKWGDTSTGSEAKRYRSMVFNLNYKDNQDFRRRVLLGHLTPSVVAELSTDDMASDCMKVDKEKIKQKAIKRCERAQSPEDTCSTCGEKGTTNYQINTGSADEPKTTDVSCVSCGNRRKFC